MQRPTLENQIKTSKMSGEELVDCLMPHGFWQKVDFQLHWHFNFLWRVIHWNWFDVYEGMGDADKYRTWYIKLKRKLFGGNGKIQ